MSNANTYQYPPCSSPPESLALSERHDSSHHLLYPQAPTPNAALSRDHLSSFKSASLVYFRKNTKTIGIRTLIGTTLVSSVSFISLRTTWPTGPQDTVFWFYIALIVSGAIAFYLVAALVVHRGTRTAENASKWLCDSRDGAFPTTIF